MAWLNEDKETRNEYIDRVYGKDNKMAPPCITELDGDIRSFNVIQEREREIFIERREQYGNHLENAKRFPIEDACGLYLKCVRAIRDIEATMKPPDIKPDTLIDLAVYPKLIQSAREDKRTGG